jgi:ATP-dependent Clp protease ATP-binding subunit ClpC
LSYFTVDMNDKVSQDKGFELFQREREIDRLVEILSRKVKNNPIILGEPGVGKTALVEGLAKRINDKKVPKWLQDKKIMNLEVGGLIAGSMFRGEFEQRVKILVNEMAAAKNCILFIDELHTVIGAGNSSQGGPDLASIIKPALSRGEIAVIGATTEDEYRTIIKKDKAFERRFQTVRLDEPDEPATTNIIKGIKSVYEAYHNVKFPDELVTTLVELTGRFIADRYFPDKAIDILDECMVRCRIEHNMENAEITEQDWEKIEKELLELIKAKNDSIINSNASLTEILEQKQKTLESRLTELNLQSRANKNLPNVTKELLEKTVSEVSGVPLVRVSSSIFTRIKNLQSALGNYIFGQEEPIEQISRALKRTYAGVNPNKGPIAGFLLLGPTGVGKTELVKLLTQELYGDVNKYLLKIDMSEFREKHNISRLLGAPAGYVGYEDAPQLTEFLRKKPYSVILFDEIEKGHPDSLNILLQMLEDGKVTDSKGNSVSCEHSLIFLTSNLGKTRLNKFASKLGFIDMEKQDEQDYETIKTQVMEEVEKSIKPEILGRITAKIVFRPITQTVLQKVINKELGLIQKHLLKQGRTINFAPEITECVAKLANTKIEYGAREVKSLVAQYIQDPIAEFILDNTECMNMTAKVDKSDKVMIEQQKPKTVLKSKSKTKEKVTENETASTI